MNDAPFRQQLGDLIANRRRDLGLTQRDLADRIPIREATTISRWERGERAPTNLEAVARALDTTAEEMLLEIEAVKQSDRRRVGFAAETQLDRIERAVNAILARLVVGETLPAPEGELGRPPSVHDPIAADQRHTTRRRAADSR